MDPSPPQVILEAVRLAAEADIGSLQDLISVYPGILKLELLLRILLSCLPESVEPSSYTGFLRDLAAGSLERVRNDQRDEFEEETSEEEANRQLRSLRLCTLSDKSSMFDSSIDPLSLFLVSRAHLIDAETGNLSLVKELVEPFLDHSREIRTWAISTLLPLLRINYERFMPHDVSHTLESFEELQGEKALDMLLSASNAPNQQRTENGQVGEDMRSLVGPWILGEPMRKRRKIGQARSRSKEGLEQRINAVPEEPLVRAESQKLEWSIVNDWLFNVSTTDLARATQVIEEWRGPEDVDYGEWGDDEFKNKSSPTAATTAYLGTLLGIIYSSPHTSADCYTQLNKILARIELLANIETAPPLIDHDNAQVATSADSKFLSELSQSDLEPHRLRNSTNRLTVPSKTAVDLARALVWSAQKLESLGHPLTLRHVAYLCLFDGSDSQQKEYQKLVRLLRTHGVKDDFRWTQIRRELLQLRSWTTVSSESQALQCDPLGVFCRVGIEIFETELLQAYLFNSRYKLAIDTYCSKETPPIHLTLVHNTAVGFAFSSYDGASNGNMTRGGVRKARETLGAFQPHFPDSEAIKSALALISATHALSFYSLTLQHGIPFQPVNIRVHSDPISLISKVLDQNPKSYTKLEDLLEIGRNLVRAGMFRFNGEKVDLFEYQEQRQLLITEQRIIAMAISASLAENDFDTAYSYIVNRLSLSESSQSEDQIHQSETAVATPRPENDIAWRAAYQAGQAPLNMGSGQSELRRLEQRMELLSQALLLAPISAVGEILDTWRMCEGEMNAKATQEVEVETTWDDRGSSTLPGNFTLEDVTQPMQKPRDMTRNALNEEAPMGLFDVARGAASALSRSAFPLRSPQSGTGNVTSPAKASPSSSTFSDQDGREGEGRVRKRDVVSNMVTGGLVSGIGWVLGAPPKE